MRRLLLLAVPIALLGAVAAVGYSMRPASDAPEPPAIETAVPATPATPATPANPVEPAAPVSPPQPTPEEPAPTEPAVTSSATPSPQTGTQPLGEDVRARMTGTSWHPDCPVHLDDLVLLLVPHWGLDGLEHTGRMVVHRDAAADVHQVFAELHDAGFPIQRMRLIDAYDGDDDRSMAANNTSAFNCRRTTGGAGWSEHAYGTAIDINPVQNPYVRGDQVEPPAGAAYTDRDEPRPGMVVRPGPVVEAFERIGWQWGGDWQSLKDYQHFSQSGR